MKQQMGQESLDRVGGCVSALCAVHCASMPMVIGLLPALGLGLLASDAAEYALMSLAIGLASVSLAWGYRLHRSWRALPVLGLGILCLLAGRALEGSDREAIGATCMVTGGIAIAGAHGLNLRLGRRGREPLHILPTSGRDQPQGIGLP